MMWTLVYIIGALLGAPVALLLLGALYLYRLFVIFLARVLLRPCLGFESIVSGLDAYFLVDRPHELPHFSLSPCYTLEGHVDLVSFRRKFLAATVPRTDPGTRRLFQYPIPFMGFNFWKWDTGFNVEHHIVEVQAPQASSESFKLIEYLALDLRTPYAPGRPLWKITLISGAEELGNTLLIFKFHHAIMDATALMEFAKTGLMSPPPPPTMISLTEALKVVPTRPTVQQQKPPTKSSLLQLPAALREAFAEFKSLNDSNLFLDAKRAAAKEPGPSVGKSDWLIGTTARFTLSEFKPAREALKVPATALFLAAIAGGLEGYMQRYVLRKERPASIHFLNPFPPPDGGSGRPARTMGNYFTMSSLCMTLAPSRNLKDRIMAMHTEFQRSSRSSFPVLGFQGLKLLGVLPLCIQGRAAAIGSFTCIFSNIAGPPVHWNIFGHELLDFRGALPLPNNKQAFGFILISYADHFRIFVTADRACIPNQVRVDELCELIGAELDAILVQFARSQS